MLVGKTLAIFGVESLAQWHDVARFISGDGIEELAIVFRVFVGVALAIIKAQFGNAVSVPVQL